MTRAVRVLLAAALCAPVPATAAVTAPLPATVTRGPYLQVGTPDGVRVRWRTDAATDSRVRWGLSPAALTFVADDAAATTDHEVALTGLSPDTRYFYSVGSTTETLAGGDSSHSFVTAPAAGAVRPTRVWVIGDAGTATANQLAVRDAYAAWTGERRTDLWLMLGDNAYFSGTDAEYQNAVFNVYGAMLRKSVVWPTRGNHDFVFAGPDNDYYDFFTLPAAAEAGGLPSGSEAYYSFDHGNLHFVCLDSEGSGRGVGDPMAVWLRGDLASTSREWVIAYWHHPPYSKGSHDSDNPLDSGGRMRDMRQNILPILDSTGVDLVLTGHSHSYERSFLLNGHYGTSGTLTGGMKVDDGDGREAGDGAYVKPTLGTGPFEGAVYAVAGSSGLTSGGPLNHPVMVISLNVVGSMVLDVAGNRLDARFLNSAGGVQDSFTILKGVVGVGPPSPSGPRLRLAAAPNPAGAGGVRLLYELTRAGQVSLDIVDAAGRRVSRLCAGQAPAGVRSETWNGRDRHGRPAGAGVYFAVLETEGERRVVKVTWGR